MLEDRDNTELEAAVDLVDELADIVEQLVRLDVWSPYVRRTQLALLERMVGRGEWGKWGGQSLYDILDGLKDE